MSDGILDMKNFKQDDEIVLTEAQIEATLKSLVQQNRIIISSIVDGEPCYMLSESELKRMKKESLT